MKWFKHMSDARQNDKLVCLKQEFGIRAIGIFWDMVERVAGQYQYDDTIPCVTLAVRALCQDYAITARRLRDHVAAMARLDLLQFTMDARLLRVEIPSVLKHKDNSTRNLQATCKRLASDLPPDVDVEQKKKKRKKKKRKKKNRTEETTPPVSPKKKTELELLLNRGITESAARDFLTLRKAKRAPLTEIALNRIESEAKKADVSLQDAIETCCANGWAGFKADWGNGHKRQEKDDDGQFAPHPRVGCWVQGKGEIKPGEDWY